jgi:hypothetical protein
MGCVVLSEGCYTLPLQNDEVLLGAGGKSVMQCLWQQVNSLQHTSTTSCVDILHVYVVNAG